MPLGTHRSAQGWHLNKQILKHLKTARSVGHNMTQLNSGNPHVIHSHFNQIGQTKKLEIRRPGEVPGHPTCSWLSFAAWSPWEEDLAGNLIEGYWRDRRWPNKPVAPPKNVTSKKSAKRCWGRSSLWSGKQQWPEMWLDETLGSFQLDCP